MTLCATIYCFEIPKDESLKDLVFDCGYSRPTAANPRSIKHYTGYFAEIERKEGPSPEIDRVFIRVSGKDENTTVNGLRDMIEDLEHVGLISDELIQAVL